MPNRDNTPSDPAAAEAIGEIRGQMRELIHSVNNQSQRSEAVARIISKLEGVPDDIKDIKERLTTLETDRHRRDGERGVIYAILRSPTLGWMAGAGATVWAYFTGRLHL